MPTANSSRKTPRTSKPQSRPAPGKTSKLGSELSEGIRQAAAHFRGEVQLRSYEYHFPPRIDVRAVRQKTGLSQADFAARYALSFRTLQEWEQGRAEPDLAVRAYLTVIDRNPRAVEQALAGTE